MVRLLLSVNLYMKKQHLYVFWIVFIFCTTAFSTSFAQMQCKDLFLSSKEPLDILATLEAEVDEVVRGSLVFAELEPELPRLTYRLQALFENAVESLDSYNTDQNIFSRAMQSLSYSVVKIKKFLFILETRQRNTDYKLARENPILLSENRLYSLQSMDTSVERVSFSREVLEGVFWSEQPLMQRAAGLIFRGIDRGRKHATDKSGIIAFTNDSIVYKVKITGDVVGAIRVAGFFNGRDFHIVTWSKDSLHNDHSSHRLTERVRAIRENFLRTGHY